MERTNEQVIALANLAADALETRERENGDVFIVFGEGAPDWAQELSYAAHGSDFLPDDYRYRFMRDAIHALADASEDSDLDDVLYESTDLDTDVMNASLLAWLSSNLMRAWYVDEATDELGHADGIMRDIMLGQLWERREVAAAVLEFIRTSDEIEEGGE